MDFGLNVCLTRTFTLQAKTHQICTFFYFEFELLDKKAKQILPPERKEDLTKNGNPQIVCRRMKSSRNP